MLVILTKLKLEVHKDLALLKAKGEVRKQKMKHAKLCDVNYFRNT